MSRFVYCQNVHARTVVAEEMIGADRNIAFLRFRKIVGKAGIYHGAPFRGFYKGKIQILRGEDTPVDLPLIRGNVHTPHGVFRFRRIIEQNHAVINEQSRSPAKMSAADTKMAIIRMCLDFIYSHPVCSDFQS